MGRMGGIANGGLDRVGNNRIDRIGSIAAPIRGRDIDTDMGDRFGRVGAIRNPDLVRQRDLINGRI